MFIKYIKHFKIKIIVFLNRILKNDNNLSIKNKNDVFHLIYKPN